MPPKSDRLLGSRQSRSGGLAERRSLGADVSGEGPLDVREAAPGTVALMKSPVMVLGPNTLGPMKQWLDGCIRKILEKRSAVWIGEST